MDRDEGRDISEKIALGMLKGTGGKLTGESLYDSRLFNQSSGMDAGFGGEDEYNTYTKPLFDKAEGGSIYRPKQSAEDMYGDADTQLKNLSDTSRFKADKGFRGAETSATGGKRDAPVQFERAEAEPRSGREDRDSGRDRGADASESRGQRGDSRDRRDSRDDRRREHSRERERGGRDDRDRRDHDGRGGRDRDSARERDRDAGGDRRRGRAEEEDPFGISDIVNNDSDRKRSRRD